MHCKQMSKALLLPCCLLLVIVSAGHALTPPTPSQFMCYACQNCAVVNANTPTVQCNEQYFEATTLPDTTITTEEPNTETSTPTTEPPTTESTTTESTTRSTTTTTEETTETTEAVTETEISSSSTSSTTKMPTPGTVAPPESTTAIPTPPNPSPLGVVQADLANSSAAFTTPLTLRNGTVLTLNVTGAPQLLLRQRRQAAPYSYHCYALQVKQANNTLVTERGCARIPANMAACKQLEAENTEANITKCVACTMPLCNSSGALQLSLISVFASLLVFALTRGN